MQPSRSSSYLVMAGLDPAILFPAPKKRIPGSSPGMTGGGHQQSPSSSPARPLNQVQREGWGERMSAGVELDHVTVRFGQFTAVDDATLDIRGGEFFSFLGPSGCGKTTILRTVSGFLDPSAGKVRIGGQDMGGIGPNKRPTALIFQNLA
eukprot:gene6415-8164_t